MVAQLEARSLERPLSGREVAKFAGLVALLAILADSAIGHGLTWENDPYWTYWITKTFLIGTVFAVGTAWLGVGVGRGAILTAIHTLILTIYYWSFSPVGLPSSPEWLDFEHTWLTGVPIHFGVIYLGYLIALWIWRRTDAVPPASAIAVVLAALGVAVGAVVVAGVVVTLALGEFPGFTWFLTRVLITTPLVVAWLSVVGRDRAAAIIGAVVIALAWADYGQYLGPVGLPSAPIRILDPAPPPAVVHWLDFTQLWLISLPVYIVVLGVAMLVAAELGRRRGWWSE